MTFLGEREAILKAQEIMDRRAGKILPPCVNEAAAMVFEGASFGKCHETVSRSIMGHMASIATSSGLTVEHQDTKEIIASSNHGKIEVRNEGTSYRVRTMRNDKVVSEGVIDCTQNLENAIKVIV